MAGGGRHGFYLREFSAGLLGEGRCGEEFPDVLLCLLRGVYQIVGIEAVVAQVVREDFVGGEIGRVCMSAADFVDGQAEGRFTQKVVGKTVLERMNAMVDYLMRERYNEKYGLLYGAMTADWGDVQPNDDFGCDMNDLSDPAIDVYDNAMFIIALDYLLEMAPDSPQASRWKSLREGIERNVRAHLWDVKRQKFIPHIYPEKSPIPEGFDELAIHYHGGTAIAIEAGLLSKDEIRTVNAQMLENVRLSGMPSIGLTLYPVYPDGFFHGGMSKAYLYQNGGDWTWFGGRMIQQLVVNGMVEEAYAEIHPMIERVIQNDGFYEWYGKGGVPSGSGNFKGSAGVLSKAIELLRDWAEKNKS